MASIGKKGKRFQVRFRDTEGNQRGPLFGTEREAIRFRAKVESGQWQAEEDRHGLPDVGAAVNSWLARRLASVSTGHGVERATAEKAASLARRIGASELADVRVDRLKVSQVSRWLTDLAQDGYAPNTLAQLKSVLKQSLDVYLLDDQLDRNVAQLTPTPGGSGKRHKLDSSDVLSMAQFAEVLAHIEPYFRSLFLARAYLGTRVSEGYAIKISDVNFLRGTVSLGREVVEEVNGVIMLRPRGKTDAAEREAPMPKLVADALSEHVQNYLPSGLLWTDTAGGPLRRDNVRRRVWEPALMAASATREARGLDPLPKVSPQHLRHSGVSWMVASGRLSVVEIAYRIGHRKPSLLLDVYSRFLPPEATHVDPFAEVG